MSSETVDGYTPPPVRGGIGREWPDPFLEFWIEIPDSVLIQTRNARRLGVETILITGANTLVGANLMAELSASNQVFGVSADASPNECFAAYQPTVVIHCGSASNACWASPGEPDQTASDWAEAARVAECRFVLISSDAVFSGPWMFHEEDCSAVCESPEAKRIRAIEQSVIATDPNALVVRTHAFGWTPTGSGWLEDGLAALESQQVIAADTTRHATPILATELASLVMQAIESDLTGVCHIAGAERVNPTQFWQQVAREFGIGEVTTEIANATDRPARGFGRGETSLDCQRVRQELGGSLPMLSESLRKLHEQAENGFRDQLQSTVDETLPVAA